VGRLSSDAVVANDAGVRVVVRTAAWPGPSPGPGVIPVEMVFDNGSSRPILIERHHVAFVTPDDRRLPPLNPSRMMSADPAFDAIRQRALAERTLAAGERTTGFVYFAEPDSEQLELRIDLIDASTGERFGEVAIPFARD
jgi:hypothetical protein